MLTDGLFASVFLAKSTKEYLIRNRTTRNFGVCVLSFFYLSLNDFLLNNSDCFAQHLSLVLTHLFPCFPLTAFILTRPKDHLSKQGQSKNYTDLLKKVNWLACTIIFIIMWLHSAVDLTMNFCIPICITQIRTLGVQGAQFSCLSMGNVLNTDPEKKRKTQFTFLFFSQTLRGQLSLSVMVLKTFSRIIKQAQEREEQFFSPLPMI